MECGIALGSNTGDRLAHLRAAVAGLRGFCPVRAVSRVYETAPVDCPEGSGAFLNAVAVLDWGGPPRELLAALRSLEEEAGRPERRPKNAPRTVDLDILYVGDVVWDTAELTLPHPRLHERRFVLEPLADVRPELVLPGFSLTVSALLAALDSGEPPLRRAAVLTEPDDAMLTEKLSAFAALKREGRPSVCLTAADYPTARLLDEGGVDLILAGDSLGMVALGYPDTVEVTLEEMLHHTRAVRRGVQRALVGGDLPFHTYQTPEQAVATARQLMAAGADAVKLEGGVSMVPQVAAILAEGIPVLGHIGMLPQSVREEGGYKKKGRTEDGAAQLIADAVALDRLGVTAIVLEGIVPAVAARITAAVECGTIGIGAGSACDGQILVTADLVGSFPWFRPPFATARGDVAGEIRRAVSGYAAAVRAGESGRGPE